MKSSPCCEALSPSLWRLLNVQDYCLKEKLEAQDQWQNCEHDSSSWRGPRRNSGLDPQIRAEQETPSKKSESGEEEERYRREIS